MEQTQTGITSRVFNQTYRAYVYRSCHHHGNHGYTDTGTNQSRCSRGHFRRRYSRNRWNTRQCLQITTCRDLYSCIKHRLSSLLLLFTLLMSLTISLLLATSSSSLTSKNNNYNLKYFMLAFSLFLNLYIFDFHSLHLSWTICL